MSKHLLLCTVVAASFSLSSLYAAERLEDFPTLSNPLLSHANWLDNPGSSFLTPVASGGPDGGSFVSTTFNFQNTASGDTPVLMRANLSTPFGPASQGKFFTKWIHAGVTEFSFSVRHNAPLPLGFFTRFAAPANFPGAIAVTFAPVLPNTWTDITFSLPGPNFVSFEDQTFEDVFHEIGRLQIGVSVPVALAGQNVSYTFDLDKVSINIPEPSTLLLGGCATMALGFARRRSR